MSSELFKFYRHQNPDQVINASSHTELYVFASLIFFSTVHTRAKISASMTFSMDSFHSAFKRKCKGKVAKCEEFFVRFYSIRKEGGKSFSTTQNLNISRFETVSFFDLTFSSLCWHNDKRTMTTKSWRKRKVFVDLFFFFSSCILSEMNRNWKWSGVKRKQSETESKISKALQT